MHNFKFPIFSLAFLPFLEAGPQKTFSNLPLSPGQPCIWQLSFFYPPCNFLCVNVEWQCCCLICSLQWRIHPTEGALLSWMERLSTVSDYLSTYSVLFKLFDGFFIDWSLKRYKHKKEKKCINKANASSKVCCKENLLCSPALKQLFNCTMAKHCLKALSFRVYMFSQ